MFDVGMSELGVIGIVALIVIGPEQLPRVARTAGHVMGRMRRYVSDVKSDINREMEMADLKRMQEEMNSASQAFQDSVREQVGDLNAGLASIGDEANRIAPEPVVLAPQEVVPAQPLPAEPAETGEPVAAVDENQLDLFGAPREAAAPEKH